MCCDPEPPQGRNESGKESPDDRNRVQKEDRQQTSKDETNNNHNHEQYKGALRAPESQWTRRRSVIESSSLTVHADGCNNPKKGATRERATPRGA